METVPLSLIVRSRLFLVDADDDMLCESSKVNELLTGYSLHVAVLCFPEATIVILLCIDVLLKSLLRLRQLFVLRGPERARLVVIVVLLLIHER